MNELWTDERTLENFAEWEGRAHVFAVESRARQGQVEDVLEESLVSARALELSGFETLAKVLLLGTAVRLERVGATAAANRLFSSIGPSPVEHSVQRPPTRFDRVGAREDDTQRDATPRHDQGSGNPNPGK